MGLTGSSNPRLDSCLFCPVSGVGLRRKDLDCASCTAPVCCVERMQHTQITAQFLYAIAVSQTMMCLSSMRAVCSLAFSTLQGLPSAAAPALPSWHLDQLPELGRALLGRRAGRQAKL